MASVLLAIIALCLIPASAQGSGELYLTHYLDVNMAARADGANPRYGLGIHQIMPLGVEGLHLSLRGEALFDGRDRNGSLHDWSFRYTIRLKYDVSDALYVEAERFAWNPISHRPLPPGMKENLGGGDTMSAWALRGGIKW